MLKYMLISLYFYCVQLASAQEFLVINGSDGFANIREWNLAENGAFLKNGTVVFWIEEYDGPGYLSGWLSVRYSKDDFCDNVNETVENMEMGLVHESQVVKLETLSKPTAKEFSMKYVTQKFNFDHKKIIWDESKTYIESINGKKLVGSDCGLPKTEIVKAEATMNGKKIRIKNSLLLNILGATDGRFQYFKKGNTYFAVQSNGYDACFYYVVWVFEQNKLRQRLIGDLY